MTTTLPTLGAPELWDQYGLPGLVCMVLSVMVFLMWRFLTSHLDRVTKMHHSEREDWRAENRLDRKEFVASIDRMSETMLGLRDVLNEMKGERK